MIGQTSAASVRSPREGRHLRASFLFRRTVKPVRRSAMSASTSRSSRAAVVAICLGLLALMAGAGPAAAANTITVESLTLCVKTSGPEKGIVRFNGKSLKCKKGEKRVQVVGSGKQGVLGVTAESGAPGASGAEGKAGADGKTGAEGKEGKAGADGKEGKEGK